MQKFDFDTAFSRLTGHVPFPWQRALYERFIADRPDNIPSACNLATGLGKTSVIAVWLIALAAHPQKMPRRLVYVVNRRTVVDQTTNEVENLRKNLRDANLFDVLKKMCAIPLEGDGSPLAISTLRGQFADNREWSADPSRPAVICGTVDMIGSRLLFSGYGCGFKSRPLHAGFLGQDVLLVHDEAHLELAFQKLLLAIECEQQGGRLNERSERVDQLKKTTDFRPLRVMELSATSRGEGEIFKLSEADEKNDVVKQRIHAAKEIAFHPIGDEKKQLTDKIIELALAHQNTVRPILIFVRSVEAVGTVVAALRKQKLEVQQLTGTLRGLERDRLVDDPIFRRFLPKAEQDGKTAYLVCTSAGEVGVNISADHLVCDLSTFESMAQRFGRVNRFGACSDTRIDVVHPTKFNDDELETSRTRTLTLLQSLNGNGSPSALDLKKAKPPVVGGRLS